MLEFMLAACLNIATANCGFVLTNDGMLIEEYAGFGASNPGYWLIQDDKLITCNRQDMKIYCNGKKVFEVKLENN